MHAPPTGLADPENVRTPTGEQGLIPGDSLPTDRVPGHWLLARLGKRVLRPGGRELTDLLLGSLDIGPDDDVVELAPGLGSTTELVLARNPASYRGVDRDPVSTRRVAAVVAGPGRSVVHASAAATGLPDSSADVAFGEAYLTMQPERLKRDVATELARIVRPGGRVGIHEVAFADDAIDDDRRSAVNSDLTASIKVSVRPETVSGWVGLLSDAGFDVHERFTAPLHLLEPRRLVADEGIVGAARFGARVALDSDARRRVLAMRSAMRANAADLQALALTATRRGR
ncbi:MAG: methyltransferase domain-containing protein [Acidimicrobiia bacterium]